MIRKAAKPVVAAGCRLPGEEVPVVRQAVGERRAVVEHPLLATVALLDRRAEGVVALSEREDAALDLREIRRRRYSAALRVGGIRHLLLLAKGCSLREDDPALTATAAVPPRLRIPRMRPSHRL